MRCRIADSGGMSGESSLRYIRHAPDVFNSLAQVLDVAVVRLKARFRLRGQNVDALNLFGLEVIAMNIA